MKKFIGNTIGLLLFSVFGFILAPLMAFKSERVSRLLNFGHRGVVSGLTSEFLVGTTIKPEDILYSGPAHGMPRWLYKMEVSLWTLQDSDRGPVMFIKLVDTKKLEKLRKMGYIK